MYQLPCRSVNSVFLEPTAEKVRQQRSRIVQTLNVPQRVRLGPSLAAALLDSLSEQPAKNLDSVCGRSYAHGCRANT
jgi:hypothetical protein